MGFFRDDLGKKQVILITADEGILDQLEKSIGEDFSLLPFSDLDSAEAYYEENRYFITMILMGEDMPFDGRLDVLKKIRCNPVYNTTPVLIVSDQPLTREDEALLEAGAIDFLTAPFVPALLNKRLENAVRFNDSATYDEMEQIFHVLPSNLYLKDGQGRYVFATHYWHHLDRKGDPYWTIRGKTDVDIRKDRENALAAMEIDRKILETGEGTSYLIDINVDDTQEFYQVIKEPILNDQHQVTGIVGLINDVTDTETLRRRQEQEARRDSLTRLLNRSCYDQHLEELKKKDILPVSFIAADCNGLKEINDTYGHLVGDEYIRMSALVLRDVIPQEYPIYRIGGDEFVAILEHVSEDTARRFEIEIEELQTQFQVKGKPLSLAVGSSCRADRSMTLEASLDLADRNMYRMKERMKNKLRQIDSETRLNMMDLESFLEVINRNEHTPQSAPLAVGRSARR